MSRYMALVQLAHRLKAQAWPRLLNDEREALDAALAMPESPTEIAIREDNEKVEEALRMNF